MKKLNIIILIVLFSTNLFAEKDETKEAGKEKDNPPQTLLSVKNASFSGYGAPVVSWARIGEKNTCLIGGKAGLIINDHFVIGGAGYGLIYPRKRDEYSDNDYTGDYPYINFGYGGGLLEYYFMPKSLMPISLGVLVGGGGIYFSEEEDDDYDDHKYSSDKLFIVQPELTIHLNVTRFFRIGAGISYRFTHGVDSEEFDDKDFSGMGASFVLAFGWF